MGKQPLISTSAETLTSLVSKYYQSGQGMRNLQKSLIHKLLFLVDTDNILLAQSMQVKRGTE
ncbi:MAG: hypothetical protein ACHBN1_24005 [Heteroscytonema crispum UTEX LB 1556]